MPILCLLTTPLLLAPAQDAGGFWTTDVVVTGSESYEHAGRTVDHGGDLDGDGHPDFVIGSPGDSDPNGQPDVGSVKAYSGATHALLWVRYGSRTDGGFGTRLSFVPDTNGDGVDEVVTSEPWFDRYAEARIVLLDGRTGAQRWSARSKANDSLGSAPFPWNLHGVEDLDGDGLGDVLFAHWASMRWQPFLSFCGRIQALNGVTGAPIYEVYGGESYANLGQRGMDVGPDVTGDGVPDFLVSRSKTTATSVQGFFQVRNGRNGGVVGTIRRPSGLPFHSDHALLVPDLDGDGEADLVAGRPRVDAGSYDEPGVVAAYSGRTGARLWQRAGQEDKEHLGDDLDVLPDLDGDGRVEILVGAGGGSHPSTGRKSVGSFRVLSGVDGELLLQRHGRATDGGFGRSVAGTLGPAPARRLEVLAGSPTAVGSGAPEAGGAELHRHEPFLRTSTGALSAAAGGVAQYWLDFPVAEAGKPYVILASLRGFGPTNVRGVDVPLGDDPLFRARLAGQGGRWLSGGEGTLDFAGDGFAALRLPANAASAWIGSTVRIAGLSLEPGLATGRRASAAVLLRVSP